MAKQETTIKVDPTLSILSRLKKSRAEHLAFLASSRFNNLNSIIKSQRPQIYQHYVSQAQERNALSDIISTNQYLYSRLFDIGRTSKSAKLSADVFRASKTLNERMRFTDLLGMPTGLSSAGGSAFAQGAFEPSKSGVLADMAKFYRKRELTGNVLKSRFENLMSKETGLSSAGGSAFAQGAFEPNGKGGALSAMARFYRKQELQQEFISKAKKSRVNLLAFLASSGVLGGGEGAQENKAEKTISGGIQKAFGGKGKLAAFLKSFGFGHYMAASGIARLAKGLLIDVPYNTGAQIRATYQSAMLVGASPQEVSGLGYALQSIGGKFERGSTIYGKLNQLYTGAKFGAIPQQFLALAQRYRIPFMSSSGIATPEQYIESLSNKLASSDARTRADIAGILGLQGPELELLSGGYASYQKNVERAGAASIYTDPENAERLKEFTNAYNAFGVEFKKTTDYIVNGLSVLTVSPLQKMTDFFQTFNQYMSDKESSILTREGISNLYSSFWSSVLDSKPLAGLVDTNPVLGPLKLAKNLCPFSDAPTPIPMSNNSSSQNTNITIDLKGLSDIIISPNTIDKWTDAINSTVNEVYTSELGR